MASTIVLSTIVAAGLFAYLAIQMDDQHAGLKIFNLGLFYFTTFIGILLGSQYLQTEHSETSFAGIAAAYSENFMWIMIFVFAYLVIYFLYTIMKEM